MAGVGAGRCGHTKLAPKVRGHVDILLTFTPGGQLARANPRLGKCGGRGQEDKPREAEAN